MSNEQKYGPLPPPPRAASQDKSREILRLWRNEEDGLEVVIRAAIFEDPFCWGIALVDIAHHVATFAVKHGLSVDGVLITKDQVLERVREGFDAEWDDPTDEAKEWEPDA